MSASNDNGGRVRYRDHARRDLVSDASRAIVDARAVALTQKLTFSALRALPSFGRSFI
jgi:hypothetical protein